MALSKTQEQELVKRYLNNTKTLRSFLKGQDLAWIDSVIERFMLLAQELKDEAELELAEIKEREEKRLALIAMIEAEGWSVEDLIAKPSSKKSGSSAKRMPKYRYTDENGKEKGWSGAGLKPKALQALLDNGHSLDEFLVKQG